MDISFGSNITSDPIHVDVFGLAQDDMGATEPDIVHDVTTNPFVITPMTRAPSLSLGGMVAIAVVLLLGATLLLRRRTHE